jgi:hypothetical protein
MFFRLLLLGIVLNRMCPKVNDGLAQLTLHRLHHQLQTGVQGFADTIPL